MVDDSNNQGWIKLHRKSLNSSVWLNPNLWQLWCWCLLKATHQPLWVPVKTGRGYTEVNLKPGQFIFGRFSSAKELRSKPDATYKRLQKLKKLGNVTTQNHTHFTIVSVNNWDFYQNKESEITTQVPPKYQPSNTNKNKKNEKKGRCREFIPPTAHEVKAYAESKGDPDFDADKFIEYYSEADPPWHDSKGNPVRNWKQKFLSVWLKKKREPKRGDPDWYPSEKEVEGALRGTRVG